jgi:signal transduction histidine kinase
VLFAVIPATLGVAILRYRLYDLDLVVRRTVAYAGVTAVVAGLYLAIVAVAQLAAGGGVSLGVHVVAAVAAAAVFQPVRTRIQQGVDRVFYGDRSRPYEAVARLGRQLEGALVPETVLPGAVETVAGALRLPYAAIELRDGENWVLTAEHGRRHGEPVSFPMAYQAEVVGRMLVCPRGRAENLSAADRRLVADLARQAGVAAHAVRATAALQRSRAELVSAREEERRRLRRDLHDGLGPTLAGVTMGLHAAGSRVRGDPDEAERLLATLERQIEEAVADIRRLVYGLRPPALDEFGLVRALQLHAARMEESPQGLTITVDSPPEGLGKLPAAVEVAAYRIVTEALTNVTRHAGARCCVVRLSLNGSLELEVVDDGRGLPADLRAGIGITAMRERAAELGGTLTVESRQQGTRVRARLPALEAS